MTLVQATAAENIRKSTLTEIQRRREVLDDDLSGKNNPWGKLSEIGLEIQKAAGGRDAMSDEEAFQLALERNPLLFQLWMDGLPPGASPLKDSPRNKVAASDQSLAESRIETIVEAAHIELEHKLGHRPDFQTAWDYAHDMYPKAFA